MVRTTIGYGSPNKQGQAAVHGAPLGSDEVRVTKKTWVGPWSLHFVPEEVREHFAELAAQQEAAYNAWSDLFARYRQAYPGTLNVGMNGIVQKSRPLWQKRKSYGSLTNQWPRGKHPVK